MSETRKENENSRLPKCLIPMTPEELEKFIPLTDTEIDEALREGSDLVEKARRYSPSINLRRDVVYR